MDANTRKQRGRAREIGVVVPITIELPLYLDAAIEQYKAEHGASKRWIVIKALVEFMANHGDKKTTGNPVVPSMN